MSEEGTSDLKTCKSFAKKSSCKSFIKTLALTSLAGILDAKFSLGLYRLEFCQDPSRPSFVVTLVIARVSHHED